MTDSTVEPATVSRSGRRLPRSENGVQRHQFTVTLSAEEHALLRERSLNTGDSMSRILVRAAMNERQVDMIDGSKIDALVPILSDLLVQLRGVATNVNQLAHWANTEHAFPAEAQEITAQVKRLSASIDDLLEDAQR